MTTAIPLAITAQRRQRLPRPQAPHTSALSRTPEKPISTPVQQDPWQTLEHLGDLLQGKYSWSMCLDHGTVVLVKRVHHEEGKGELRKVQRFHDHPNVAVVRQVFMMEDYIYFKFDYTRYTLEEILCVRRKFGELHIQVIASSIFFAIQHIAAQGVAHNAISLASIRICNYTGTPQLSNFDDCTWINDSTNNDLEHMGIVILECMKGAPNADLRNVTEIRSQREANKLFGIENGEKWSGCKLLIDFLDHLFNEEVTTEAKLNKEASGKANRSTYSDHD